MKREVLLSPACRAPQLWGWSGEKEHTRIIVELPEDIAACNFYRAKITIKGKLFRTDYLEILDGKVCFELTSAMVETSGIITAQIIGYVVDENGDIEEIGKTEIYKGNIKKSLSGKLTPADSDPSLLDRILAKVHVLLEKMHSHTNAATLDKFSENTSGGLLFGGKEIGGIQSLTAFPAVANEGDVILLHRCNEISSDDSNSGVVLDTAALASLKLPEGITHRRWEFEAPNPTGKGFILVLEQDVIEEDEPYELTGIFLLSENYGGRWYWRDGKPYDGISNVSPDPIPALIPLGKVSGFTVTKDLMFGFDIFDVEDTDNTTIFRTVPREYMYSGGEWKLTERTDIAEGNLISDFGEIEKDGQKFYRLNLTDSRSLKNRNKKTVDIPISGVKKFTETIDGVKVNGDELTFPVGEGGTGLTEEEIATAVENYFAENPISGGGYSMAVEGETLTVTANAGGVAPTVENETIIF